MNEERTGKCLRQVKHIRGHMWHIYSITVNQVMVATVKLSKWWLQLDQQDPCWQQPSIKEILIGTASSGISYQLRDLYCNVATYKWKVHNEKIELISFIINFVLNNPSLSISNCRSRYAADLSVSVVSFISSSLG
jgi:hypothetical protein